VTIVVGYIPNQYGQAALAAGIAEARLRGLRLVVVNATKGDAWVDTHFASDKGVSELESQLESQLAGGAGHEVRQSDGPDIAEQILDVVRETGASLLVIGLRHRSSIGKMFMGSTAQALLMEAPCPVLAVKAT
jgi:nucleotide-binding universal stress UspA family protein